MKDQEARIVNTWEHEFWEESKKRAGGKSGRFIKIRLRTLILSEVHGNMLESRRGEYTVDYIVFTYVLGWMCVNNVLYYHLNYNFKHICQMLNSGRNGAKAKEEGQ